MAPDGGISSNVQVQWCRRRRRGSTERQKIARAEGMRVDKALEGVGCWKKYK